MQRRRFLTVSGAAIAGSFLPGLPGVALANAPTESRLVVMILRGGLDGLHALIPYADPHYARLRPKLAVARPGEGSALDLDGTFALHANLGALLPLYRAGELTIIPAATTRYRDRSHFDGQNLLECGGDSPFGLRDGWLNRSLAHLTARQGLALGPSVPMILQGDADVTTWADSPLPDADEDFLNRVASLYRTDPALSENLMNARNGAGSDFSPQMGGGGRARQLELAAKAASALLAEPDGPRIAVIESQGWDTHFAQERRLDALFNQLASGVDELKRGLGSHWRNTCVVVVSEFGRTAAENGSGGTDPRCRRARDACRWSRRRWPSDR